jgi:hypothetical protein
MPDKNPDAMRHGGPGSSHQKREHPEKSSPTGKKGGGDNSGPVAGQPTNSDHSRLSGGGGERDRHHAHDTANKS